MVVKSGQYIFLYVKPAMLVIGMCIFEPIINIRDLNIRA